MGKTIKKIFKNCELTEVCNMYMNGYSTRHIAKYFHTSSNKIKKILYNNGIDIHDPECQYLKRKPSGYWNNKERCELAAKNCVNRTDFYERYEAAYEQSVKNGWIDEFDQYFSLEPHFSNFNERIHLVYVYEINETHSVYIGRTTDLKRRHSSHLRGSFRTHHRFYKDSIYEHCNLNNVEMPEPIVLENNLTAIESRAKENDWISKYKESGWNIINRARTGENSGSLGATMRKWNYDSCKDAASKCVSKIDFKTKFSTAYRVSVQNKWINEFFTTNLLKESGYFDKIENCIEEAKKYKNLTAIKKNYPFLYHKICEKKWNDEVQTAMGYEKWRKK